MTYELALISVLIGAGYWGFFFVRHRPHGSATFGVMQLAAAALAGIGLLGHRIGVGWLGVPGAIGLGAGACLLVVGPAARVLARRAVAAERMAIATRLLDLAELLAPGSGVAEEKALVRAMSEIREGRIDPTVDALTRARERASADARLAIDERIAMLYLAAYRWSDAIAHAEAHLFGALPTADCGAGPGAGDGSLRRALGLAPPVWVDLLGAYGRLGDLDQAARMLIRLEDACAGRDDAALWLHRGRMMFLALAGRTDAVRALVAPRQSRHMSVAARTYWIAVAHEHQGDRAAAAQAYEKARSRSRGRPRDLIDQALAGLADAKRTELAQVASEVVARVEAAPLPPKVHIPRPPRLRATWVLTGAVLVVWASLAIGFSDTADIGALLRGGAMARGVAASGEWWRAISCLFVHVGLLHLVVNAIGLIVLGMLVEDLFGASRMVAIFAVSGIAGALASYFASPVGISAGASGAVFGLLAALFVEITWHRAHYAVAWKRGLWGALIVIAVSQIGYGFVTDVIDQWAHGGGLVAGVVLGAALSPTARWARAGAVAARAIALGFAAAVAIAAVFTAEASIGDSLARGGMVRRVVDGVAIEVPASWPYATQDIALGAGAHQVKVVEGQVAQPDGIVMIATLRQPQVAPAEQLAMWTAEQRRRNADIVGGDLTEAAQPLIEPPAGWDSRELIAIAPEDAMGHRQRWRIVVCGRAAASGMIFAAIYVPEAIAAAAPGFFARLLASIGPA